MKNILVIDPSIMIHKIVQLAFPENEYNLFLSNIYPPENLPGEPLSLILLSADLQGQEDSFAAGNELKQTHNCPVLMMIPKFFEYDSALIEQYNLDGIIEKPFTSDTLKEKWRSIETGEIAMEELDGLSPEELESITEEEFMLSEEDLLDIGEEELADIEIPDTPLEAEEPETADISTTQDSESLPPTAETDDQRPPIPSQTESEPAATGTETPFEDMGMDEDLDSIDFGDLEDGESLLDEAPAMESDSLSEEETLSTTEQELANPPISEIIEKPEMDNETEFTDMTEELLADTEDIEEETEEPLLPPGEIAEDMGLPEHEEDAPQEVGPQTIREAVAFKGETEIPSPEPEQVLEEAEGEPLENLLVEESGAPMPEMDDEPITTGEETEMSEEELPDVNFAIEEEPQTVHVDEYEVNRPMVEEEETVEEEKDKTEEVITPLDISRPDEEVELIPPPSSLSTDGLGTESKLNLSDADIQKIAQRVVSMLSDKAIRDIAWEVIPVMAEEIVRSRIRQLENEEVE